MPACLHWWRWVFGGGLVTGSAFGSGLCLVAGSYYTGGGGGGLGGWVRGQKKVCVPKIDLQVRAPLINFIFLLRKTFLMWVGGWVGQPKSRGANLTSPPVSLSKFRLRIDLSAPDCTCCSHAHPCVSTQGQLLERVEALTSRSLDLVGGRNVHINTAQRLIFDLTSDNLNGVLPCAPVGRRVQGRPWAPLQPLAPSTHECAKAEPHHTPQSKRPFAQDPCRQGKRRSRAARNTGKGWFVIKPFFSGSDTLPQGGGGGCLPAFLEILGALSGITSPPPGGGRPRVGWIFWG